MSGEPRVRDKQAETEGVPGVPISEMPASGDAEGGRPAGPRQGWPTKVQKVHGSLHAGQERHVRGYLFFMTVLLYLAIYLVVIPRCDKGRYL